MNDQAMLDGDAVAEEALDDWRYLRGALFARFATGSFASGLDFVVALAVEAEAAQHHPDVDLRYGYVDIKLRSHDVGYVTQRDVRLARAISSIAASRGLSSHPEAVAVIDIALDVIDQERISPFWAAVLGRDADRGDADEIVDADGRLPTLWFQPTDDGSPSRQRFHVDLNLPPEVVEARMAAALAQGGRLVSDAHAPLFWVLADPEGNKICLCTWPASA